MASEASAPSSPLIWQGWLFALTTSALFSFVPPLTTVLIHMGLEPVTMLAIRYILASLVLFSTTFFSNPAQLRIKGRILMICIACGLLYFVSVLTFTQALVVISTSVAIMLFAIYPLLVLLLLALRGEKLTWRNNVRLALGLGGVFLLIGPGGQVGNKGIMLVMISLLCYSSYLVLMQWYLKDQAAQTITFYVILTITIMMSLGWLLGDRTVPTLELNSWLIMGFIVIGGTYLAQVSLLQAVRRLGSGQIALLSPLEILLTLVWSAIILADKLSPLQWLGGVLILLSMFLAVLRLKELRRLWRARVRLRL